MESWTIRIDADLSIHGEGDAVTWRWDGGRESVPDNDEVVALVLKHIHEREQAAYAIARQLKSVDAEDYEPAQRRDLEDKRREAHADVERLRAFVKVMEAQA